LEWKRWLAEFQGLLRPTCIEDAEGGRKALGSIAFFNSGTIFNKYFDYTLAAAIIHSSVPKKASYYICL
jgi:hypothetical protein